MNKFNFDPKLAGFSFQNALALAEASALAYEDEAPICTKAKGEWGFDDCKFKENNETQFYIANSKDMILLAFRGTEQNKISDIFTDLLAVRKKIFWGSVHMGFWDALDFVFKDIVGLIKIMQDNHQPIWITGHSLGGALATLAAARLVYEEKKERIQGVYTYGQPYVGDQKFKESFDKIFLGKFFRLTNLRDPVSVVPFKCWKYDHVGEIVLFDEQGKRIEQPNLWIRIILVGIPLVAAVIAYFGKKKDQMTVQMAKLIAPHNLEIYRSNITKNIT